MGRQKELILFLLILAIAVFFRFWQINEIPPGLYHDVAVNGNDALDALKTKNFKLFYPENNGREGLFINLIALSFYFLGPSVFAIKIVAAIIGILTVLGLYLLAKEIFNSKIALLSSFFLATSFWHVNFSRLGFRAILVPFCLVFSFYFLFRGFRTKSIFDFIISGVFFGLGFHAYISFRMAVLILPVILISYWFIYKKGGLQKKYLFFIFYFLFFIFIVALPIGLYFLHNPQDFMSRATGVSVFSQPSPVKSFFESLIKHLGMFNVYGDPNWRHNLSGSPMLPPALGILFIAGFVISFRKIILSIKNKNWSLEIGHWSLIVWFFVMLLPGVLTYEGLPHDLRVIGVIPPVYIFAGFGFWKSYEWLNPKIKNKKLLFAVCCLLFIEIGYAEYDKYFIDWGHHPETKGAFSQKFVDIGNYLNSLLPETKKYVIVNEPGVPIPWPDGIPMTSQTPIFIERTIYGEPRTAYLKEDEIGKIEAGPNTVIVPMKFDEKLFDKLKELYPGGEVKNVNDDILTYSFPCM